MLVKDKSRDIFIKLEGLYWVIELVEKEIKRMRRGVSIRQDLDEVLMSCCEYAPCTICVCGLGKKNELYRCIEKNKKPVFQRTFPDGDLK